MASIPEFKQLSKHYLDYLSYPQPEPVRKLLGGELLDKDITNTCTVRMSHTMNLNGHPIPRTIGKLTNRRSKQGLYYIIRVTDFRGWMRRTFGPPQFETTKAAGKSFDQKQIRGYEGIIAFEIGFKDASGHFDLWYGDYFSHQRDAGHDYFADATHIELWHTDTRWLSPEL